MYKLTMYAPEWAIAAGKAKRGETDVDYFEDRTQAEIVLRESGCNGRIDCVSADNDDTCYVNMWGG